MITLLPNRTILEADKAESLPLATFKNNSLPIEQEGDRALAFLSKDTDNAKIYLTICEFLPNMQTWSIRCDKNLKELSISVPMDYNSASIALFDDRTGSAQRFFVFIGYGKKDTDTNKLYYFVFDSSWNLKKVDSFNGSLWQDAVLFRKLTLAPISEQGKLCWLFFGYDCIINDKEASTFKALKLSYHGSLDAISYSTAYTYSNGLRFPRNGNDYTYSNSVHYMGVSKKALTYDLVVQCVGKFTQNDDVLYIHQIGNESNTLRYSQADHFKCNYLFDHGIVFVKLKYKPPGISLQGNLAMVRDCVYPYNEDCSFIRYVREPDENSFLNYKIILKVADSNDCFIPMACKVFHLDSGNMSDDADNQDLVVIHRIESCNLQNFVLKISNIQPGEIPGKNCLNISANLEFLPEFNSTFLANISESKLIRHTRKITGTCQTGYFITLFYHDVNGGISYHTLATDFQSNNI